MAAIASWAWVLALPMVHAPLDFPASALIRPVPHAFGLERVASFLIQIPMRLDL